MNELRISFAQVSAATEQTVPKWIPSYCGIDGNEEADRLAGEGSLKDQTNKYSIRKKAFGGTKLTVSITCNITLYFSGKKKRITSHRYRHFEKNAILKLLPCS